MSLGHFGPRGDLPDADLRIVMQSPMMGFELPLRPRVVGLPAVKLAGEGKPLLGLQSATQIANGHQITTICT